MSLSARLHHLLDSQEASESLDSYRFISDLSNATESDSSEVAFLLKKTIKSSTPTERLRALRLLHRCIMTGNKYVHAAVVERMMKRLMKFAMYKKESTGERRGEDMFEDSLTSYEQRSASVRFLTVLLTSIRDWARRFSHTPDSQPTAFSLAYDRLIQEGVVFPADPNSSLRNSVTRPVDLDAVRKSIGCMEDMLRSSSADKRSLSRVADTLRQQSSKLQLAIESQSGHSEADLSDFLLTNDRIRELLQQYEVALKTTNELIGDLNENAATRKMEQEIQRLKQQAAEIATENAQTEREIRRQTVELEEKFRSEKARLAQDAILQQKIDQLLTVSKGKDEEILSLRQTIAKLQRENQELTRKLPRNAQLSAVAPYCNMTEFRSTWFQSAGILVNTPLIRVFYKYQVRGSSLEMQLQIQNHSPLPLSALSTRLIYKPGEGIELRLNRETEDTQILSGHHTTRIIAVDVTDVFPGVPAVSLSCSQPPGVQVMAFLPLSLFLLLEPTQMDPGEAISVWMQLDYSKMSQKFVSLHGGTIEEVADVFRKLAKVQVFTYRELTVLSSKSILLCAKRNSDIVMVKIKTEDAGGSITVESSSERLRTCMFSILALSIIAQLQPPPNSE